ncbi:MAG TPA: slipin family protein [Polyangiaceae bacterium]|nr:slipin family protein [Polyangiaceae bacterium]
MIKVFNVGLSERVVVFKDGLPMRALGPGRHTVWGTRLMELRWDTDKILFKAAPEVRALMPADWFAEAHLGALERGVIFKDDVPVAFLRPGVHRFWTVDPSVRLTVFRVDGPMPELTDELVRVLPKGEYVVTTVIAHQRGLKFVRGELTEVLPPGRYALWSYPGAEVALQAVDMRTEQVALVGQELMTRDKVTLRLSLTVEYAVADPARVVTGVANVKDAVYLLVQLAARQFVSGVSLDELLEGRDAMTRFLEEDAVPKAAAFGVRIERVGVKDVVLPGEMKTLLNRVIEAEKEAAANVILRREETAATRSLANTARVMADQPMLLRLKELESFKEIAGSIQEVRLVVGADSLKALLPTDVLGKN